MQQIKANSEPRESLSLPSLSAKEIAIKEVFSHLSARDIAALEPIMRELCEGDIGHVLFGNKPVADESIAVLQDGILTGDEAVVESLLTLATELMGDRIYFNVITGGSEPKIVVANRKKCLEIISAHEDRFEDYFGPASPELYLKRVFHGMESGRLPFELRGILYGYGRDNSRLFTRRAELTDQDNDENIPFGEYIKVKRNALPDAEPSPGFLSAQEELDVLCARLKMFSNGKWEDSDIWNPDEARTRGVRLPSFLGIPDSAETVAAIRDFNSSKALLDRVSLEPDILPYVIERCV